MSFFNRLFKKKQPDEIAASAIIPVLRTSVPGANLPVQIPEDERPIAEPLAADIVVFYAVDTPAMLQFVNPSDLRRLGIAPADLRALALKNISRSIQSMDVRLRSDIFWVSGAEGREATLLLQDFFWDDIREKVKGDVIAAVPGREFLVFAGSGVPGMPGLLSGMVQDLYARSQAPLSTRLVTRLNGQWKQYDQA